MRDTKLIFILTTGNMIMTSRLQMEKFVELNSQVQRKYIILNGCFQRFSRLDSHQRLCDQYSIAGLDDWLCAVRMMISKI